MRARLPLTVALALATPLLLADTAKPRDGSSSSSSSRGSSSSDRHPSPSSSGHSSRSGASSDSRSSRSSSTPRTEAQARHPRPGTGHDRRSRGGYYYYPYGYSGHYRYGYPYYYGYGWYDSYYYPPYYPYRYNHRDYGSLRVMVEPNKTRVYVDGYYAGLADEFDGIFQRLNVSPGRHEIALKLEGYRTHRVRLYVAEDHTVKLRHDMVRGEGEDPMDDRVGGPEYRWRDDARDARRAERDPEDAEAAEEGDREPAEGAATLRLRVTPEDASIYVDGRFRGTGRQLDDLLMPPGKHRVEVVRPGFRTYDQELDVRDEEPLDLEIALERL